MALSLSTHHTYPGTNPNTISVPTVTWTSNYVKDATKNEKNTMYFNEFTAPATSPTFVKTQRRILPNIYQGSSIPVANRNVNSKGTVVHLQYRPVYDVLDSADASYDIKLPLSCTITMEWPQHDLITEAVLLETVGQALRPIFDSTGSTQLLKLGVGAIDLLS